MPLSCAHEWPLMNTGSPAQQPSGAVQGLALPVAPWEIPAVIFCSGWELLCLVGGENRGNIDWGANPPPKIIKAMPTT